MACYMQSGGGVDQTVQICPLQLPSAKKAQKCWNYVSTNERLDKLEMLSEEIAKMQLSFCFHVGGLQSMRRKNFPPAQLIWVHIGYQGLLGLAS